MAEATIYVEQSSPAQILRQLVLLAGIAASVALGVYVFMWSRTPHFSMLYSDLSDRDMMQIADTLKAAQIPYQVESGGGAIMVDASKLDDARMKLAAAGLPKGSARGFELLDEKPAFGTSQFLERARYQHAIEGELARSIGRIDNIRAARVQIAQPPDSVFARQRRESSASVIVDLYPGRNLTAEQTSAISHLVSASVPSLAAERVTIVDSRGNLLTGEGGDRALTRSSQHFDYSRRLELSYVNSIETILTPMVGPDGVRAQVNADLDFTQSEQTRESYDPDAPSVRSERSLEEEHTGEGSGGIPGALSNSPAAAAAAPEQTPAAADAATSANPGAAKPAANAAPTSNRRKQSTRNYELDRTISHTKPSLGAIRRLSVAVVVRNPSAPLAPPADAKSKADDKQAPPAAASITPEQIERMTQLVKQAIGFDLARGDTVSVTAADFLTPPIPEPLPARPMWQQPWVTEVGKQALGALFVLFLVFGVLKPTMKSMLAKPLLANAALAGPNGGAGSALPGSAAAGETGVPALSGSANHGGGNHSNNSMGASGTSRLGNGAPPHEDLDQVKQMVAQDPRIAAQVIKNWVGE